MKSKNIIANNKETKNNIHDFIIYKKIKKSKQCDIIMRNNYKNKYPNIINFILFNIILFSLLRKTESGIITIKFNKEGLNQFISDDYSGELPNKVNGRVMAENEDRRTVEVNSIDEEIILEWEHPLSYFSFMFSGLKSIRFVSISNEIVDSSFNITMNYMFKNCVNLTEFYYLPSYDESHMIIKLQGMFSGCISLESLNLDSFYLSDNLNMANMFYKCNKLERIIFNEDHKYCNITYSREMFHSCFSLTSINLTNFGFNKNNLDLSLMFYDCKKLATIIMPYSYDNFGISNMYQMFYGCESLTEIEIKINKVNDYKLDLSQLFYNCTSLINININFPKLNVEKSKEMFYNCYSLKNIEFIPRYESNYKNMNKMFYNCTSIESIYFDIFDNSFPDIKNYYTPTDMAYMFYNCKELKSLTIKYINTTYLEDMKFMLYNCESLQMFNIESSIFSNDLITNMKGMFKNLKSITSLDLTTFYTPNVTIMWDMFNGCTNLISLIIPNFDTSKVTDMQSMFEGCSNITSLNLNHFNTTNVQYMNKMFKDCINLTLLIFSSLTTESLGTMYRMFYNCQNLTYLNLYSLTETSQSISEMFNESSNSFKLCIKDAENIPNIYQDIYEKIERDCSNDCYNDDIIRKHTENKKSCCSKLIYNDSCYDECPIRTKEITSEKKCEDLNCLKYYNYHQNRCIDEIPVGYYMNDSILKTIDKCNENCKTCNESSTNISMNCLSCKDDKPFLYLGNCFNSCLYGEYEDDNGIKKCKCFDKKCSKCSEESLKLELCEECNDGYYPKQEEYEADKRFIDCYSELEEYYLEKIDGKKMFKRCYYSCEYCISDGNKSHHNCISCNQDNRFSIPYDKDEIRNFNFTNLMGYSNYTIMNCYPSCMYNYLIDDDYNYTCLDEPGCPKRAPLLVNGTTKCVKSCKKIKNKYQFQNKCFLKCPPESIDFWNWGYYCKADCPRDKPFEMKETQTCHQCCKIMARYNKSCITNYHTNKEDEIDEINDMIMTCIKDDIVDTFNYSYITKTRSLILDEYPFIYEITSTDCTYVNPDLGKVKLNKCEQKLRDYYLIPKNVPLYILKIDAFIEGKVGPKVNYEVYCPYGGSKLHQLDISICEGLDISIEVPINITIDNIDKYDRNSGYYNDICYTYTNENGTDVTLEDRQEEFKTNNRSVCDEGCKLVGVTDNNERAECSCDLVFNIPFASQISVDKDKLYKFMNIKNIANFKVMVCINLFFSAKGIKENIGFYCLLLTLIVYFVCLYYFYSKEYKQIKIIVNEIVFAKKHEKYLDKEKKFKKSKKTVFTNYIEKRKLQHNFNVEKIIQAENKLANFFGKINNKQENTINIDNDDNNQIKNENINPKVTKYEKEIKNPEAISSDLLYEVNKIKNAPPIKSLKKNKTKMNVKKVNLSTSKRDIIPETKSIPAIKNKDDIVLSEKQKQKIKFILSYIDEELNDLSYKKAVEDDKRTYFQYYYSLLKTNHTFIKIFNKRDYNAYSIKVLLFFFDFASNFAVNALFFNDDTMHQIYNDGGDFNIIYQLPQIIYSTIISIIIDSLISFLGLSQDDILSVKHVKKVKNVVRRAKEVLRALHLKFILFFIITFLFIILYWYYLGCFCAVYTNTQFHLIKDTLIGYGTGSITPFGKYLAPGLFRIPSLKKYGKGKKLIYILSQFLQKI